MSGRRLPIHTSATPATPPAGLGPLRLAGRSVAVADTGSCELAMHWAARFANGLLTRGARPQVVLTSFDARIDVPAEQRRAFAAIPVHTLELGGSWQLPRDLPDDATGLWVLVGQPALLAFQSDLSVLLGAALPVLRWPENMRALRAGCTLSLGGDGLDIAHELARQLPLG